MQSCYLQALDKLAHQRFKGRQFFRVAIDVAVGWNLDGEQQKTRSAGLAVVERRLKPKFVEQLGDHGVESFGARMPWCSGAIFRPLLHSVHAARKRPILELDDGARWEI